MSRGDQRINHIFFADNNIFFYRATLDGWTKVKNILATYKRGSGQAINANKLMVFFSSDMTEKTKQEVAGSIGDHIYGNAKRYFGLPVVVGRSKYNFFQWIKELV